LQQLTSKEIDYQLGTVIVFSVYYGGLCMKKLLILCLLTIVAFISACGYKDSQIERNKEDDYMNIDNDSIFQYNETNIFDLQKLASIVFERSDIQKLYEEIPFKFLRENNGTYYTMYCLDNNKICYIVFEKKNEEFNVDNIWIYSNTQISKKEFIEVINYEKAVDWDEFADFDTNMINFGFASSTSFYWVFLREGETAFVAISLPDELTDIVFSKNIYDVLLEKDMPYNILRK